MGKCKTKAIQTDLGLFRHNQAYPGIIQACSGIFSTPCEPGNLIHVMNLRSNFYSRGSYSM